MDNSQTHGFLSLSRQEMRELGYSIVDMAINENAFNKSVACKADRTDLEKQFKEALPEKGMDIRDALQQLQQHIFNEIMHVDHPRFFAYIPSPSNFVSVMADTLASGFNINSMFWSGAAEIELVTIDWLRPRS